MVAEARSQLVCHRQHLKVKFKGWRKSAEKKIVFFLQNQMSNSRKNMEKGKREERKEREKKEKKEGRKKRKKIERGKKLFKMVITSY